MLDINKQRMKYSQHGQRVTVYERDDDGEIKYYVDGDGNKIPLIAMKKSDIQSRRSSMPISAIS